MRIGRKIGGAKALAKRLALTHTPRPLTRAYFHIWLRLGLHRREPNLRDWLRFQRFALLERDGDPARYDKFLRWADPALTLPELSNPRFTGRGWGSWNLRAYRTGMLDGEPVFEKVYHAKSDSWRKITWAHSEVLPRLETAIQTPTLLRHVHGEWLVAAYFPLLSDVSPIPVAQLAPAAVAFQKAVSGFRWSGSDPVIRDFRREESYAGGRRKFGDILTRAGRDPKLLDVVEHWLQRPDMPHRFTHGDLVSTNILACGTILDFDRCGYYPAGYEYGRSLGEGHRFGSVDALQSFVDRRLDLPCWKAKAAVFYFAAVFYSRPREAIRIVSDDFILSLWDRVIDLIEEPSCAEGVTR